MSRWVRHKDAKQDYEAQLEEKPADVSWPDWLRQRRERRELRQAQLEAHIWSQREADAQALARDSQRRRGCCGCGPTCCCGLGFVLGALLLCAVAFAVILVLQKAHKIPRIIPL
eukprot:m51a1_g13811 putative C-tail anchored protein (114) ;mRNA; f:402486-402877